MGLAYLPWHQTHRATAPCLRDDTVELTYAEFDQRIAACAEQFAELGFQRGDVVAIMLPNRAELLIALFAAWRLGGAATPVNPAFTPSEADYQIEDSGARLVVNLGPQAPSGGRPTIHVDDLRSVAVRTPPDPVELAGDEVALIIYTSGSTGRPKGVLLDHTNADAMSGTMAEWFALTSADHCLLILPLFHVNAIMVSALSVFRVGGQLSVIGSFSPSTFFDHVERLRPTYFSAVPTIYALLTSLPEDVQPDTSSLRFVVCGAAPVSAELLERCEERFGF